MDDIVLDEHIPNHKIHFIFFLVVGTPKNRLICCGYANEPSTDGSFAYPQHLFPRSNSLLRKSTLSTCLVLIYK